MIICVRVIELAEISTSLGVIGSWSVILTHSTFELSPHDLLPTTTTPPSGLNSVAEAKIMGVTGSWSVNTDTFNI